jgi:serine/threonine-protein kinase
LSDRNLRVEEAVLEYLQAADAGAEIPISDLIARYPDLGAELNEFAADQERVNRLANCLRVASAAADTDSDWTAESELAAIQLALGSARKLEPLARGGMGAVYRGDDPGLGRELAVKVLRREHKGRVDLEQRFIAEARLGARLDHPGVVPVHAAGRLPDGRPYFTMRLIRGRTLAALLADRSSASIDHPRLLKVFEQICQTIAFAHSKGVIHRDLKPLNVMVGAFGEIQVMDWGFAKVLGEIDRHAHPLIVQDGKSKFDMPVGGATNAGQVLGTPAYMPPEQANGEVSELDARSDVFGLGAILCEILTGDPPYRGRTQDDVFRNAQAGHVADARERLDSCGADADLAALATSCLAPIPADRPRDAAELAAAVSEYIASVDARLRKAERERAAAEARAAAESRELATITAKVQAERHARRVQIGLATSLVGLALVVGGGGAWWWGQRTTRIQGCENELTEALPYLESGRWTEAREHLVRAESWLAGGGSRDVVSRLDQSKKDAELGARLDEIRLLRSDGVREDGEVNVAGFHEACISAFRTYGIDLLAVDPPAAAHWIINSAIRESIVVAVDIWAQSDGKNRERLQAVVDAADRDDWRRQFRLAARANNGPRLLELMAQPGAIDQPPAVKLELVARSLAENGHDDWALNSMLTAQRHRPDDFWANEGLARWLHHSTRPPNANAIGYYRAAVAVRPKSQGAWINLGTALYDFNDARGAAACFQRALEIDPEFAIAHGNLGNALSTQGRAVEAEREYRTALRLMPSLTEVHTYLGNVLACQGRFAEAEIEHREVLRVKPGDARARVGLGYALNNQDRSVDAEREYRAALRLKPDLADAHVYLGHALSDRGQFREGEAEIREGVRLKPELAQAHYYLGNSLMAQARYSDAEQQFREAIHLKPDLALAHGNMGIVLAAQRRLNEAEAAYRTALTLQERLTVERPAVTENAVDLGGMLCNLANLLRDRRDMQAALDYYAKAIERLEPVATLGASVNRCRQFLGNCHSGRAETLTALNRHADTVHDWDRAFELDDGRRRHWLRLQRAISLGRAGDVARAEVEAESLAGESNASAARLYECARVLALAAAREAPPTDRLAARAVELLRQAVAKGLANAGRISADTDFDPLRQRNDFRKLTADLTAATPDSHVDIPQP